MDTVDRCRYCGASGPGRYAEFVMAAMEPAPNQPVITHQIVFICATCVREMEADEVLDRELMQDPEFAATQHQLDEEHAREFHEALVRSGIKIN